ncbi:hypothetical protein LXA43DRAFT_354474 [Ganoderma leucocontextum]|nr:hypothetical protein LXA43DRAFT_354474 [Ganoderma leucocontextum]
MASSAHSSSDETFVFLYAISSYGSLAMSVLLLYDWIITLPREVETFWSGNSSTVSAFLYFANRTLSLSMAAVEVLDLSPMSNEKGCTRSSLASLAMGCLTYIPPAAFSALRAYALSQRRGLSLLIFVFFLVQSAANITRFKFNSGTLDPALGCSIIKDMKATPSIIGFLITIRVCVILADALLIAITWRVLRPSEQSSQRRVDVLRGDGLVCVMLRDGAVYFIVMLLLHILDLGGMIYPLITRRTITNPVTALRTFLPPVLMSRFLLDLQEAHQRRRIGLFSDDTSRSIVPSSIAFAPALGALGAAIEPTDRTLPEDSDAEEAVHRGDSQAAGNDLPVGDESMGL